MIQPDSYRLGVFLPADDPLDENIGMMTGKTERQTASCLKRGYFLYLLLQQDSYMVGDLLPADDPFDENRDSDREDGEANRQLVDGG